MLKPWYVYYDVLYDIWWLPSMTSTYILLKIHPHFPKNKRRHIIYSQLSSIARAIIQKNWSSGNWWIKGNRPRLNQSSRPTYHFQMVKCELMRRIPLEDRGSDANYGILLPSEDVRTVERPPAGAEDAWPRAEDGGMAVRYQLIACV